LLIFVSWIHRTENPLIRQANALLVLGTSLTTLSSYRLVLEAIERKLPTALINIGETRADSLVSFKIEAVLGDVLEKTFDLLNKKIHL
jgi:NAD-dependent deacetylase sirtuin 4